MTNIGPVYRSAEFGDGMSPAVDNRNRIAPYRTEVATDEKQRIYSEAIEDGSEASRILATGMSSVGDYLPSRRVQIFPVEWRRGR